MGWGGVLTRKRFLCGRFLKGAGGRGESKQAHLMEKKSIARGVS